MSNRIYPIGIQNFEKIRVDGYFYVDKTALIYQMVKTGGYYFLSRPRRFGKSLLISTLEAYFSGKKELFEGLAMEKLEKDWIKYPVIHLDLNAKKFDTVDDLIRLVDRQLLVYESQYGSCSKDVTIDDRLVTLIRLAAEKTGQRVVILVDEYDKPMLQAIGRDELQEEYRNTLKAFYGVLKSMDGYIKFAMLTGVTKFGKVSVFSDLNNLDDISMRQIYVDLCGISEQELHDNLESELHELADAQGVTYDEICKKLRDYYDGYHFTYNSIGIYNPFSLFNAFAQKKYANFWFSTGTPTFLIDLLQETDFDVRQLEGVEATDEQFDAPTERVTSPIPVLYQSGYLTIKGYDPEFQVYRLAYPNGEVRKGFIESLLPAYLELPGQSSTFYVVSFIRDLRKGDIESCLERTRSFFASIPNDLENKTEKHYQTIFYLLFRLMGMYVDSEVKSAVGRADVVIKMQDAIYVLEFKYDGTAREALAQINSRLYAVPYRKDGRRIVKVGINFDSATRTIGDWVIEVEDTVDNL